MYVVVGIEFMRKVERDVFLSEVSQCAFGIRNESLYGMYCFLNIARSFIMQYCDW